MCGGVSKEVFVFPEVLRVCRELRPDLHLHVLVASAADTQAAHRAAMLLPLST